jgi:hypothetical protein
VGKTLFETHSTHKITDEYRALAEEIEGRLSLIAGSRIRPNAEGGTVLNG